MRLYEIVFAAFEMVNRGMLLDDLSHPSGIASACFRG